MRSLFLAFLLPLPRVLHMERSEKGCPMRIPSRGHPTPPSPPHLLPPTLAVRHFLHPSSSSSQLEPRCESGVGGELPPPTVPCRHLAPYQDNNPYRYCFQLFWPGRDEDEANHVVTATCRPLPSASAVLLTWADGQRLIPCRCCCQTSKGQ
jgi:hypothetical protein